MHPYHCVITRIPCKAVTTFRSKKVPFLLKTAVKPCKLHQYQK